MKKKKKKCANTTIYIQETENTPRAVQFKINYGIEVSIINNEGSEKLSKNSKARGQGKYLFQVFMWYTRAPKYSIILKVHNTSIVGYIYIANAMRYTLLYQEYKILA